MTADEFVRLSETHGWWRDVVGDPTYDDVISRANGGFVNDQKRIIRKVLGDADMRKKVAYTIEAGRRRDREMAEVMAGMSAPEHAIAALPLAAPPLAAPVVFQASRPGHAIATPPLAAPVVFQAPRREPFSPKTYEFERTARAAERDAYDRAMPFVVLASLLSTALPGSANAESFIAAARAHDWWRPFFLAYYYSINSDLGAVDQLETLLNRTAPRITADPSEYDHRLMLLLNEAPELERKIAAFESLSLSHRAHASATEPVGTFEGRYFPVTELPQAYAKYYAELDAARKQRQARRTAVSE